MKTLACCRRRLQDFSIDMDKEPDSKSRVPLNFLEHCKKKILEPLAAPSPG
jgi:hypothetical protein